MCFYQCAVVYLSLQVCVVVHEYVHDYLLAGVQICMTVFVLTFKQICADV